MKDNITTNKYNGFFLIELLIALAIFSLISINLIQFHTTIIQQRQESQSYMRALNLASSIIEEVSVFELKKAITEEDKYKIFIEDLKVYNTKIISVADKGKDKYDRSEKFPQLKLRKITVNWKNVKGYDKKISLIFGVIQ